MTRQTSIPAPHTVKDDCRCGHDRTTQHYRDVLQDGRVEYCNCLAMNCDCVAYEDPTKPKVDKKMKSRSRTAGKPHMAADCVCSDCIEWFWKHRYLP